MVYVPVKAVQNGRLINNRSDWNLAVIRPAGG